MKFIKIKYDIAIFRDFVVETAYRKRVDGYAFEHNGERLCARQIGRGLWIVDDYVTGYSCGYGKTRPAAILDAQKEFERHGAAETLEKRVAALSTLRAHGLVA